MLALQRREVTLAVYPEWFQHLLWSLNGTLRGPPTGPVTARWQVRAGEGAVEGAGPTALLSPAPCSAVARGW